MTTGLREKFKTLSPAAQRLFVDRLKTMPDVERRDYLNRLTGGVPTTTIEQPAPVVKQPDIPLWQRGLSAVAAPFEYISENVTKPFASIVSAPFTPQTKGTEGMDWLQRQRAEYNAWQDPTITIPGTNWDVGVKGVLETLPWLAVPSAAGVAGKLSGLAAAGGALGRGASIASKIINPLAKAEKIINYPIAKPLEMIGEKLGKRVIFAANEFTLPTTELQNQMYKPDNIRRLAQWAEDKPVLGSVLKSLGGGKIFVDAESELPNEVAKRAISNYLDLTERGLNIQRGTIPRLQKFGDPKKVLGMTEDGLIPNTIRKETNQPGYLYDILEKPDSFKFTSPEVENYIKEFSAIRGNLRKLLEDEGLKQGSVHRIVKGIVTQDGRVVESKFGSDPLLQRTYATQEDAVLAHLKKGERIIYGNDPIEITAYEIDRTVNRIARKRMTQEIGKLGKTARQIFTETYPEKAQQIDILLKKQGAIKNTTNIVQRVLSYKAGAIPGATLAKIRRDLPEFATQIDTLLSMRPEDATTLLGKLGRELGQTLKTQPNELNKAVKTISDINVTWRGKSQITLSDISDAMKSLNLSSDAEGKILTSAYQTVYKTNRQAFKDFAKNNLGNLNSLLEQNKILAKPLLTDRRMFLQSYAGREHLPHQVGEESLRVFNQLPEFRNKFFPEDVVTTLEKYYGDIGNQWTRTMGNISAMSRNLTAVLDDSAPFIQGLFVFGRRPDIWAKATLNQFRFFAKPQTFIKYMANPENQVLHNEMTRFGSTVSFFEPTEALPMVEKLVSKIPKGGAILEKALEQTYGRAEVAFTGFSQLARDYMWKSLRGGKNETQLQELARTLDLMTGNVSTKAIGIGTTQREIETAFVFFSPRFTRASLSFVGDMFRSGIAGSEARKSIAGLMAAGTAMYIGVSDALGQEPDLNPRSGKFMTIQVGDQRVGVGGILYSLARLGGNLASVQNPSDLLKVDRFDNPFIKFMYSKSAPLTGVLTGFAERADYLGRPFESPSDWVRFVAEKAVPFSIQSLFEKDKPSVLGAAVQITGLRQFPRSSFELRDEARNQATMARYPNKTYQDLTDLEKRRVDRLPEITRFDEELKRTGRETPNSKMWKDYQVDGDAIETAYRKSVIQASLEVREKGDYNIFKDRVDSAVETRRRMYALRAIDPQYQGVRDYFIKPKTQEQLNKIQPLDKAKEEYYKLMYSEDMYDSYGTYDFDKAKAKEQVFIDKFGQDSLKYIQEYQGETWTDKPPELKQLEQAKVILEPYWQIADKIWNLYPPQLRTISDQAQLLENKGDPRYKQVLRQYPQILRARELIATYRKQLRLRNPAIQQAVNLFY